MLFGACDLWADEDEWAFWASPHGYGHHVSFPWQLHVHPAFGHPVCSVVDGNAQNPERDMTVRGFESVISDLLSRLLGAGGRASVRQHAKRATSRGRRTFGSR